MDERPIFLMQESQRVPRIDVPVGSFAAGGAAITQSRRAISEVSNENTLIAERLQARDPTILGELIVRYQDRLRRYLIRLTTDRELSDDLLQEIWIRVMTKGSQFKGDSQISTWLFAIARNLVLDLRRRRSWFMTVDLFQNDGDELQIDLPSKEKTPFDRCAESEYTELLSGALSTLKPQHRELVKLRFHHEMSLCEIARVTGTPISAVKSILYRSIRHLRRRLGNTLAPPSELLRSTQ